MRTLREELRASAQEADEGLHLSQLRATKQQKQQLGKNLLYIYLYKDKQCEYQ